MNIIIKYSTLINLHYELITPIKRLIFIKSCTYIVS